MINGYTLKKVDGKTHIVHERELGESSTWVDHVINGVPLKETLEWGYGMKEIELGEKQEEYLLDSIRLEMVSIRETVTGESVDN